MVWDISQFYNENQETLKSICEVEVEMYKPNVI